MSFRILTFCGGGVRGLMSATILSRLNEKFHAKYGKHIAEQADMIAGTSTGASITGLLAIGVPPELIVAFYLEGMVPAFRHASTDPDKPAIEPGKLIAFLDKYKLDPPISFFTDRKKLLFTSFDIGAEGVPWSPQLLHNFPDSPTGSVRLLDAMSASGSMPGMLPPFQLMLHGRQLNLVDGAFVNHDPTVPAIALAAAHGHEVAGMSAIDIGTGFMRNFVAADASGWGANQWINGTGASDGALPPLLVNSPPADVQMPILNLCLNGTSTNLMPDLAGMLLGDRFAYLNPDFGDRYVPEDATSASDLEFLVAKAMICPLDKAMAVLEANWVD